jgi:hypothetical protein
VAALRPGGIFCVVDPASLLSTLGPDAPGRPVGGRDITKEGW